MPIFTLAVQNAFSKDKLGEVTAKWYEERSHTLENEMVGEAELQSRLTSEYTFLGVLRHHLQRLIEEKSGSELSRAV